MSQNNYKKPNPKLWRGRVDDPQNKSILRWHQVVECVDLNRMKRLSSGQGFALLGFCSDAGVRRNQGRVGAAKGPQAIRKSLANLAVHFSPTLKIYDVGDMVCARNKLEAAQAALSDSVQKLITHNYFPVVLGGGHEVAYGHGLGLYAAVGKSRKRLGIVNFDAHFDLRPLKDGQGTSGTPFLQLAHHCRETNQPFHYFCLGIQEASNTRQLFDTARELNVSFVPARDMTGLGSHRLFPRLAKFLSQVDAVYLTVCLDCFDASVAPGVSAPAAGGLLPQNFWPFFEYVLLSNKVVGFDVAEMSPPCDQDDKTARLAARIIFEMVQKIKNPG